MLNSDPTLFYSILPSTILPPKPSKTSCKHTTKPPPDINSLSKHFTSLSTSTKPKASKHTFDVDIKSWEADLRHLASLNRCAKSHTSQVKEAGEWLANRMRTIPFIQVETEAVTVKEEYESFNVIGKLQGAKFPDTWYVIGAHYDSTSENIKLAAPGALDNASGSAAVLEMARILSGAQFPFTVIFILFTGEEQGYFGSKKYVQNMFIKDEIYHMTLMLNMDMISLDPDIIIETREESLANIWEPLAHANSLVPKVDFNIWGSDHVTFANAGVPSILICSDHSKYPHYHRTTDLPDNLDITSGLNTITMNLQAIYARMEQEIKTL